MLQRERLGPDHQRQLRHLDHLLAPGKRCAWHWSCPALPPLPRAHRALGLTLPPLYRATQDVWDAAERVCRELGAGGSRVESFQGTGGGRK